MLRLWTAFQSRIATEEDGASMVEYALLVALIAIVVIVSITFLAGKLNETYSEVSNSL